MRSRYARDVRLARRRRRGCKTAFLAFGYGLNVFALALLLAMLSGEVLASENKQVDQAQLNFFEAKIRPVLVEHCYECHSGQSKIVQGGLRLDHREGLFQGGDSGAAVVPGDQEGSLLLSALRYEDFEMPPKGKLSDAVIRDFETWIANGAIDPREDASDSHQPSTPAENPDHWAFQVPSKHFRPSVDDRTWPLNDVDYFILAKIETVGLRPARDADRLAWLRRVTIDLTGVPPTPAEIDAFVNDSSSSAYARVVDRCLDSMAFGDRWGRHWLDLAQYADTISVDRLFPDKQAWRYRDYVIGAWNDDKPFDRFVMEQLAGDLLPADSDEQRLEQTVATSFLMQGPTQVINQFKDQLRWDIIDNQVHKVAVVFNGLTMQCARCHDHKFDPLSQRDYYSLAGILQNVQVLDGFAGNSKVFSQVKLTSLPTTPEIEDRLNAERETFNRKKLALDEQLKSCDKELADAKANLAKLKKSEADTESAVTTDRTDTEEKLAAAEKILNELTGQRRDVSTEMTHLTLANAPEAPRAFVATEPEQLSNARITIRGNANQLGEEVPRGFIEVCSFTKNEVAFGTGDFDRKEETAESLSQQAVIPPNRSGRLELAQWLVDDRHPLTARVIVNRVWKHLFGEGLVRSVDNFGIRGDLPTHPELLDDLAVRFREDGWSMKRLIRQLVLSRAYRMSSEHDSQAHAIDPNNELLWRMSRRRNEAEVLRDSILMISRQLDHARGGPCLPPSSWVGGKISMYAMLQGEPLPPPEVANRRTVYLPVYRRTPAWAAGQQLFGQADPKVIAGSRSSTTVPTQALYLLNGEFMIEQAQHTAKRLVADESLSDTERLSRFLLECYSRSAREDEIDSMLQYLEKSKADGNSREQAWAEVCHAVFASSEFMMRL